MPEGWYPALALVAFAAIWFLVAVFRGERQGRQVVLGAPDEMAYVPAQIPEIGDWEGWRDKLVSAGYRYEGCLSSSSTFMVFSREKTRCVLALSDMEAGLQFGSSDSAGHYYVVLASRFIGYLGFPGSTMAWLPRLEIEEAERKLAELSKGANLVLIAEQPEVRLANSYRKQMAFLKQRAREGKSVLLKPRLFPFSRVVRIESDGSIGYL